MNWTEVVVTVLCSALASSGLWALLTRKADKKDAKTEMLIGLAHDRILSLGMEYLSRGYISESECENLYESLYKPYLKLGGNGSIKHVMNAVDRLPIHGSGAAGKEDGDEQQGV